MKQTSKEVVFVFVLVIISLALASLNSLAYLNKEHQRSNIILTEEDEDVVALKTEADAFNWFNKTRDHLLEVAHRQALVEKPREKEITNEIALALAQRAEEVASRRRGKGRCYDAVANEMVNHVIGVNLWGKKASTASKIMGGLDFFKEIHVSPEELEILPPGMIVVWGWSPSSGSTGHISVSLGDGREASDHISRQRTKNDGFRKYRVFEPVKTAI